MEKGPVLIETLGLHHFCIENENPINVIKDIYSILNLTDIQVVNKIDLDFIYKQDGKNFILLVDLNGWSYFIWSQWDFEANLDFAKVLSSRLNVKVNYYFIDSYIATSRWIFAEDGYVTRAYYESHGQKISDIGFDKTENELRKIIQEHFVEDVFWDLYEKTCSSLINVNKQSIKDVKLYTGTLNTIKQ